MIGLWDNTSAELGAHFRGWKNGNGSANQFTGEMAGNPDGSFDLTFINMAAGSGYLTASGKCKFNGVDSVITTTKTISLTDASKFTLESIIEYDSTTNGFLGGLRDDASNNVQLFIQNATGKVVFNIRIGATTQQAVSTETIANGSTTHITCRKDGATLQIFFDGIEVSYDTQDTYNLGNKTFTDKFNIGAVNSAGSNSNSSLFLSIFYDDAISDARILTNSGLGNDYGLSGDNSITVDVLILTSLVPQAQWFVSPSGNNTAPYENLTKAANQLDVAGEHLRLNGTVDAQILVDAKVGVYDDWIIGGAWVAFDVEIKPLNAGETPTFGLIDFKTNDFPIAAGRTFHVHDFICSKGFSMGQVTGTVKLEDISYTDKTTFSAYETADNKQTTVGIFRRLSKALDLGCPDAFIFGSQGGGFSDLRFENCDIVGFNNTLAKAINWARIFDLTATFIVNSFNFSNLAGTAISVDEGDPPVIFTETITYNNFFNNGLDVKGVVKGIGNIVEDPEHVDAPNGNFILLFASQLIDKADPALAFDIEPVNNGGRRNIGRHGNTLLATVSNIPLRERIIANAETTLLTMKKANGFHFNVGLVSREPEHFSTLKNLELPAIELLWPSEDPEATGATQQTIEKFLVLNVRGVVYAKKDLDRDLNRFTQDIERVLAVDITRGGLAIYTNPGRLDIFQGEANYFLFFDYQFEIKYLILFGQP